MTLGIGGAGKDHALAAAGIGGVGREEAALAASHGLVGEDFDIIQRHADALLAAVHGLGIGAEFFFCRHGSAGCGNDRATHRNLDAALQEFTARNLSHSCLLQLTTADCGLHKVLGPNCDPNKDHVRTGQWSRSRFALSA